MKKILGLDLGTNSIGWALIDDENKKILGLGSRIFPEGVVNLGEGEGRETSKNTSRTDARGVRRQIFRRSLRKRYLLKILASNNLCPIKPELIKKWNGDEVFKSEELKIWFQQNPYELRARAIREKITLHELGRIFYHMLQRRGFQSNSRSAGADTNEKSVIFTGDAKIGKIGISETLESIKNHETLGAYLNSIAPKENEPFVDNLERIRNRYTTRQMYIDEFEAIWFCQSKFYAELNLELKTALGGRKKDDYTEDGVLFHQRPLRSQKHLVGFCSFEPKKNKCQLSNTAFELFRIYQWVNTVSYDVFGEKQKITIEEREKMVNVLLSKEKIKFKEIRKALGKLDANFQFNYKDDDNIVGSYTISNLSNKKFFGIRWFQFSEKEQEDIWHVLTFFEDSDKLKTYAQNHWGFDEEKATKISKFNLNEGYGSLSKKAILNILPFLKKGFMYDVAVALGGVKNALGTDWEKHEQFVLDNVPEIVRFNLKGGYIEPLKTVLRNEFSVSEKQLEKLYHHSSSIENSAILEKLPVDVEADKEIQNLKNPVVSTALFEIRKLVNEIIEKYGILDEIKVELARDLKTSKSKRYETRREQQRLEKENERVKKELDHLGQNPNHTNILKYKLWEECNRTCPFTGNPITVNQLFTGEIQIEHIFPWSRSLNDSYANKTLCYAEENNRKGNNTPYEFYSKQGEQKWEAIKLQALSCFKNKFPSYPRAYNKFKHFVQKQHDSDFISRQLNDTRYISKEAKNYLTKVCANVQVSPGQMTANLRHHWGLNSILNDENEKTRDDHRHHAIDALVMATATRSHLQELSKWNRYDRNYDLKDFAMPWSSFRADAENAVEQILVSHKKQKSLLTIRKHKTKINGEIKINTGVAARGQLHLETVYGKRKDIFTGTQAYHVRKPLTSLSAAEIPKIVDTKIKEIIYRRIEELGLKKNAKDNKPIVKTKEEKALFDRLFQEPLFLPNKNGNPVPIKKVRIKKNFGNAEPLKEKINQWVDLGKNHHVLIYKDKNDNLKEEVVTFWTAVERKRQGALVVQLPNDGKEIVTTLQINDMFLLGLNKDEINWENPDNHLLKQHLYRVQKFTSGDYYFRISKASLINNNDEKQQINSFGLGKNGWGTHTPIKVNISPAGKISLES